MPRFSVTTNANNEPARFVFEFLKLLGDADAEPSLPLGDR
jgi:hypothetical protein